MAGGSDQKSCKKFKNRSPEEKRSRSTGMRKQFARRQAKQKGPTETVGPKWSTIFVIPLSRIT